MAVERDPNPLGPGTEIDPMFMSNRDIIVEIRGDVKALKAEAARLAAIPDIAKDHETRIRGLERWKYGIPIVGLVALANAVGIWLTGTPL